MLTRSPVVEKTDNYPVDKIYSNQYILSAGSVELSAL